MGWVAEETLWERVCVACMARRSMYQGFPKFAAWATHHEHQCSILRSPVFNYGEFAPIGIVSKSGRYGGT